MRRCARFAALSSLATAALIVFADARPAAALFIPTNAFAGPARQQIGDALRAAIRKVGGEIRKEIRAAADAARVRPAGTAAVDGLRKSVLREVNKLSKVVESGGSVLGGLGLGGAGGFGGAFASLASAGLGGAYAKVFDQTERSVKGRLQRLSDRAAKQPIKASRLEDLADLVRADLDRLADRLDPGGSHRRASAPVAPKHSQQPLGLHDEDGKALFALLGRVAAQVKDFPHVVDLVAKALSAGGKGAIERAAAIARSEESVKAWRGLDEFLQKARQFLRKDSSGFVRVAARVVLGSGPARYDYTLHLRGFAAHFLRQVHVRIKDATGAVVARMKDTVGVTGNLTIKFGTAVEGGKTYTVELYADAAGDGAYTAGKDPAWRRTVIGKKDLVDTHEASAKTVTLSGPF